MQDPELAVVERRFGGRLKVEAKLGQGGMGAVYRVNWNGSTCALKVLLKSALDDAASMRRFITEGKVLQKFSHANIIKVHELGEAADWPYILCEFVEGESLDVLVAREAPLPWDRALDLTARILEGLSAAHGSDVIHRDIKPSNILLGNDGSLKLADFGIAKAAKLESKHTTTGMIVGTPAYIAPEVLRGEKPTPRADIYSTGVLLYELLVGRLPWKSVDAGALLSERITSTEAPLLSQGNAQLPRSLDSLVQMAMALRPVDRYPTANTFRTAIENSRRQLLASVGAPAATRELPAMSAELAAHTTGSVRGPRHGTRAVTKSDISGELVPPRLSQKLTRPVSALPAAERNLVPLAVALLAFGCVTVFAIHRTHLPPPPPPRTRGGPVTATELLGGPPTDLERPVHEDLRAGTGKVQDMAVARAAAMGERGAQLMHDAWSNCAEDRRPALREGLAACAHPLAVPALVELVCLQTLGAERRKTLAQALSDRLDELERSAISPAGFPRRELLVNVLCDMLGEKSCSGLEVARVAIRALGWLRWPHTSRVCVLSMQEAQSDDPAGQRLLLKALEQFDAEPARSLAREALKELEPGSGGGLAGPAPKKPSGP